MRYLIVPFEDVVEQLRPMWKKHWDEVGTTKEIDEVDMNEDNYFTLAENDSLQVAVAMDEHDKVVGYAIHVILDEMYVRTKKMALLDIWYVEKQYRSSGIGARLFLFAEKVLKKRGIRRFYCGHPAKRSLKKMFEKMGYVEKEVIYFKGI